MLINDIRNGLTDKLKDVHIGGVFKLDDTWLMRISTGSLDRIAYVDLETGVVVYDIDLELEIDFPDNVTLTIE